MAKTKGVPHEPRPPKGVAPSAAARGAKGGRPTKAGVKQTGGKGKTSGKTGRATFI